MTEGGTEVKMGKPMGKFLLFAMAAATIIGPWLVMTNWWLSLTGPSIALAFTIVGLMCLPIGLCYGELTAMLPGTGGSFSFVKRAFGKEVSYWVSWTLILSYTAVLAFQLMAFMDIIRYLWMPDMSVEMMMLLSAIVAVMMAALNSRELEIGAKFQFILFVMLVVVGVGYAVLFFTNPSFSTSNWEPFFAFGSGGFLTATALMVTMFFGFEIIPQFAEESQYPVNKHWKLLTGSIVFCIFFYGIICLAEAGMGPLEGLVDTSMLGASLGLDLYGGWLQYLIAFANVAALLTCLIGFWLAGSRLMYAMGQEDVFPSFFYHLNKHGVPDRANWIVLFIVLLFVLMSGTSWLSALFTLMAIGVGVTYTFASAAFIKFRIKEPGLERPWKVPAGLAVGVLALISGAIISYYTFAYFTEDVWIMVIGYFAIGLVLRILLWAQSLKAPEHFEVTE
jgi:APA family basic amino acid/polyamine antiporter